MLQMWSSSRKLRREESHSAMEAGGEGAMVGVVRVRME